MRSERQGALELACLTPAPPLVMSAREAAAHLILDDARAALDRAAELWAAAGGPELEFDRGAFQTGLPENGPLPKLPQGYFYKGGAARCMLESLLDRGYAMPPRDLDVVRFGRKWCDMDTRVSKEFMPRDFERGSGVELSPAAAVYFDGRDLSINEVLADNTSLRFTPVCLLDSLGCVLRPCWYRGGSIHRPAALKGRTLLKMLRLAAEADVLGASWLVVGVPDEVMVEDFDLAIELNKALFRGRETAEKFIALCAEGGLFDSPSPPSLFEVIQELSLGLYGGLDFFDCMPPELRHQIRQAQ